MTPSRSPSSQLRSNTTAVAFGLGVLFVGMLPPALLFSLEPGTAARIGLGAVPVPAWLFTAVWLLIYPGMGVATWHVWQRRREADVSVPLSIFAVALAQNLSFWTTSSLRMTAAMDATGLLLACAVAWIYSRYARASVVWLLPWLIWMPLTFGIKLWALAQGHA